jgi:hypothetical protein
MKKAVAFLTRQPQLETLAFAEQISVETDFDVLIFSDELYREKESLIISNKFKINFYVLLFRERMGNANWIFFYKKRLIIFINLFV